MFEPFVNKEDRNDVMWGVIFNPENHELRFYQEMFNIITTVHPDMTKTYKIELDKEWIPIKDWDVIFRTKDWKEYIAEHEWVVRNCDRMPFSFCSFDCVTWLIFQDEEWEMYVAESRWTSWNVYEGFFIQEYQRLMKEYADKDSYAWFYDELEKRTFTHIERKPFLDLSTC